MKNMATQNLLVELFVEELPPKALKKLGEAFAEVLFEQLKARGTGFWRGSHFDRFAAPPRSLVCPRHGAFRPMPQAVSRKSSCPSASGLDA